jgi:hypothetical protein
MAQTIRDWKNYLRQMFVHTKPGGYVELVEVYCDIFCDDGSLPENGGLRRYYRAWNAAADKAGVKQPLAEDYVRSLEEAGFEAVTLYRRKQFLSPWPKVGIVVLSMVWGCAADPN